jgi:hypothetical protein
MRDTLTSEILGFKISKVSEGVLPWLCYHHTVLRL